MCRQGGLGELVLSTIQVDQLDVAIALAMRLGCRTVDAKRCLLTALIIRRLRAALLVRRTLAACSGRVACCAQPLRFRMLR
jgi:hypothetical protein